jgi:hypothetical protein
VASKGQATPTSEPEAEATPEPPAEAPMELAAAAESVSEVAVCLTAFDDADGNGFQDAGDALRPGVAFTISDGQSVVSNYVTDGESEPFCVVLPGPGSYRITRSIQPNEILTTAGDRAVSLSEGSTLNLEFGSTMGEETVAMVSEDSGQAVASQSQPAADEGDTLLTVVVIAAVVVALLLLVALVAIILTNRRAKKAA